MPKKYNFTVHNLFAILLSISIIFAGFCLIYGCLSIYLTGDQSYSREIVAETFKQIAIPVYFCLAFTVISLVWELISPLPHGKNISVKDYAAIINKLSAKKDFNDTENDTIKLINREREYRKICILARSVIIVVSSIIFLVYALNSSNYHQTDINGSVIKAMYVLIPCLALSFAFSLFTALYCNKSFDRELDLIKKLPAKMDVEKVDDSYTSSNKKLVIIRLAILIVAVIAIVFGYISGGTADVLTKAINICTECIGLG